MTDNMNHKEWTNKSYPYEKGWTYVTFIRGAHTKNPNKPYYVYYSPDGTRFRSIKAANKYIESCKSKLNIKVAAVPHTTVNITINQDGGTHIRWLDSD